MGGAVRNFATDTLLVFSTASTLDFLQLVMVNKESVKKKLTNNLSLLVAEYLLSNLLFNKNWGGGNFVHHKFKNFIVIN